MNTPIRTTASHPKTNAAIYRLITSNITRDSKVLDFGAGIGYMCQQVGDWFHAHGATPREHVHACEIAPEGFRYEEITCQEISTDSVIPFEDSSFDLIYAIEVLEHTPRPYDFIKQAYQKLKPGGTLIFSTPNILHFQSRLKLLLTGYPEMYGPLSAQDKNAGRICGHIMPLGFNQFHYGLRKAGFENIEFHIDRRKKGAIGPALLLYPLLLAMSYKTKRDLKRYDSEVYEENRDIIMKMNSIDVVSSRSAIIVANKAK